MRAFVVVAMALVTSLAASDSGSFQFPDWTIPVPEGTRIVEYRAVPVEERTQRIDLVEDLVIDERGADPNYLFYQPFSVAVDASGRIYVVDLGDARVQVFDESGEYLRTLGRKGQGPGEFKAPMAVAMAGKLIVVSDPNASKLSIWDSKGNHIGDRMMAETRMPSTPVFGAEDGSIIGDYSRRLKDSARLLVVARFSTDGEELLSLAELKQPPQLKISLGPVSRWMGSEFLSGYPRYVATPAGRTYVTAGDEYQLLALDSRGEAQWALRVAWKRSPVTEEDKRHQIRFLLERRPNIGSFGDGWPETLGSISRLALDGHGRLYVFPQVSISGQRPDEDIPVDVYSPDGEHLFSGLIEPFEWTAASGEFVYGIRENRDSGEREPVRYRLVEPF